MAKTKRELDALKNEVARLSEKLRDLTEEELNAVSGGFTPIAQAPKISIRPQEAVMGAAESSQDDR